MPLNNLATEIAISEQEILDYLKKKWRPEKFDNFIRKTREKGIEQERGKTKDELSFSKNKNVLIVLIALVVLVYFNSLNNDFVSDDISAIVTNENI